MLEGGNLLATHGVNGSFRADGASGGVELLTWDGDQVWSFEIATSTAQAHHRVEILPNGNVPGRLNPEAFAGHEGSTSTVVGTGIPGVMDQPFGPVDLELTAVKDLSTPVLEVFSFLFRSPRHHEFGQGTTECSTKRSVERICSSSRSSTRGLRMSASSTNRSSAG